MYSIPITFAILFLAFGALVAAGIPRAARPDRRRRRARPHRDPEPGARDRGGLGLGDPAHRPRRRRRLRALLPAPRARGARGGPHRGRRAQAAAATSGRAVLVSGFTVMASVAGMFAAGSKWYTSYAIGIIIVVAIAMVGSVTVLPALLSKLGDRVDRGRLPFLAGAARARAGEAGRFWSAILKPRPGKPPALAAVAAPPSCSRSPPRSLDLKLAEAGMGSLPQDLAGGDRVRARPGRRSPAAAAPRSSRSRPTTSPRRRSQRAIERARRGRPAASAGIGAPLGVDVSRRQDRRAHHAPARRRRRRGALRGRARAPARRRPPARRSARSTGASATVTGPTAIVGRPARA